MLGDLALKLTRSFYLLWVIIVAGVTEGVLWSIVLVDEEFWLPSQMVLVMKLLASILLHITFIVSLFAKPTAIFGDCNLPLYLRNPQFCFRSCTFSCFCSSLNFTQHNSARNCYSRLLDLIISNVSSQPPNYQRFKEVSSK